MSSKCRDEFVGKRFISVKSEGRLKVGKISEWEWRSGFIRAVSTRDSGSADFTALVEFDDTGWKSREYIKVHGAFQEFLVEHKLTWVPREEPNYPSHTAPWPALCFKPVVDKAEIYRQGKRPVEFLSDRYLGVVEEKEITFYKEGDENTASITLECPEVRKWVKTWTDYQDGQKILLTTPTVLLGYRVEVYRTEGTTQWYTAVIKSYNHTTRSLTLTDDTVLEEHNEDPTLIQMHLIGDGVVDSILNGVDVGVAQRRRPRSTVTKQNSKDSTPGSNPVRGAINSTASCTSTSTNQAKSTTSTSSSSAVTTAVHTVWTTTASSNGRSTTSKSRPVRDPPSPSASSPPTELKAPSHLKNPKPASRRKVEPPSKVTKKTPLGKKLKKWDSDENLERDAPVCKQTCNVLVKRIEEDNHQHTQGKEKTKRRPPRLRDKTRQNKKPLYIAEKEESEEDCATESECEAQGKINTVRKTEDKNENKPTVEAVVETGTERLLSFSEGVLNTDNGSTCDVTNCDNKVTTRPRDDVTHSVVHSPSKSTSIGSKDENKQWDNSKSVVAKDEVRDNPKSITFEDFSTKSKESVVVKQENNKCEQNPDEVSEDMHYKKQMLRAGGNIGPSQSTATPSIPEGIDVNRSLTEQLAKRNKAAADQFSINGDGRPVLDPSPSTDVLKSSSILPHNCEERYEAKPQDYIVERHSAFTCVPRSNTTTPATDDRADSRASDSQLPNHLTEEKRPGSRLDDIRSARSSPGSSPLIVDRYEAVNPYRDPELMRKNPVQSNVQNILAAQHKMNQPSFPSAVPGGSAPPHTAAAAFSGVPPLPARALLSTLSSSSPYSSSHQLPASISPHLPLQHAGYSMEAAAAARARQQQFAVMQQQLMGFSAPTVTTLEALWQGKFPSTPLPQPWLLQKNQEGLVAGDLAAIQREKLQQLHMEQERREMERRREVERERMEQERREKERKEIMERERLEKEKAEREKADRERIERERLERERERLEKERAERERQEWEHKHNQERILRESADTVAAVDQHFVESLTRLARSNQQGIVSSMFPRSSGGFGSKSEPRHPLPPHALAYQEKPYEVRKDDKVKRDPDPVTDDKRFINKCGSGGGEKGSVFSGFPYVSSGLYQPSNNKPVFNLYGYPSSHSIISTEQLKQRGLIPESRPIKEEAVDKKHPFPHGVGSVHPNQSYISKDIKREPHNSVIVKRDVKPPVKMEAPVAAHSHHSSPSSSSPRPQQPRPAHTPEHRPDRPLSSSSSPATGITSHIIHHSSNTPSGPSQVPPSHTTAFRSMEAHSNRSQSPYKPAASQHQAMPQPLDYCKSSSASKIKPVEHQGYPASLAQVPVSLTSSSLEYSYSLIQQGLVPNPIYSPAGQATQHNKPTHSVGGSSPTMLQQVSPPGSKRKPVSKDSNVYNRKKHKGQPEVTGTNQPMSIPVTTPQILTNPSPYTTTSSSVFSKPGITSTSLSATPSLTAASLPTAPGSSGFMDSFKSFVENTVQIAFLQDEKKAQEKERDRAMGATTAGSNSKTDPPDDSQSRLHTHAASLTTAAAATLGGEVPASSSDSSYSSRIMDTINRVANNQVDTDSSDTLSASSPPPQIKPSDTNSPLNRSGNSTSASSHPHHMKKAWLQRHDEDKKSETPVPAQEENSNSSLSHTRDMISCVENSSSLADGGQSSLSGSPANVVVTLPNGNLSDLNHRHDESTSSASEAEMQTSPKPLGPKKRLKPRKPTNSVCGTVKKPKSELEAEATSSVPQTSTSSSTGGASSGSRKKVVASKRAKMEKDSKPKDDSQQIKKEEAIHISPKPTTHDNSPQPSKLLEKASKPIAATPALVPAPALLPALSSSSPHSERSNPSPALSESNTVNSVTSCSSVASSGTPRPQNSSNASSKDNKDRKKPRRSKENTSKDGKKSSTFNKPLVKCTVATLKKTMVPFVQDGSCSEITPKLTKCRECKMTPVQRSKKQPNIFCRFYAFRRLKYSSRGIVTIEGFSELSDADPDDIEPWLPRFPVEEPDLDVDSSKFIIAKVGDKFCELVEQEREAKSWAGENVKIAWKRAVTGVREMCDVCDTTLFNMHWVCQKCGFVVCLDCYKVRVKEGKKLTCDDKWLTCSSSRQAHEASKMMLTQIIPSDALWELGRLIHDIRMKWSIPSNCPCGGSNGKLLQKNGISQQFLHAVNSRRLPNGLGSDEHGGKPSKSRKQADSSGPLKNLDSYNPDTTSSPLSILAEVASMEPDSNRDKGGEQKLCLDKSVVPGDEFLEEGEKKSGCSTLRELLTKTAGKPKVSNEKKAKKGSGTSTLGDIIQSVVEKNCQDGGAPFKFLHYTPRLGGWKRELPIMVHNLTETSVLYPDVPHSWLCDGRLLRLHDAHHKGNLQIFQEQWKRGQPVVVSCANKLMNINLWKPEVFSQEFGHLENEVVNCRTGNVIIGHTMSDFWDGFENFANRPTDNNNEPMLLKLKDWPPGDDFSEMLPTRFRDLMKSLPLPEYTDRNGKLNLASRLPDFLVRPDLGPKMYNAYGSSYFPTEGTTNLHLDISDAVNVMVYVGIPSDGPGGRRAQEEAAVKAIDDVGCDSITKRRVREVHEIPGALWHIYDAHDADKIRDFLNKVAKERGESIEKDHDAIHDQSWYLDKELCDRLLKEYGVQGYAIVQCHGDAIFIPAGAPHQVRNLHSCVKVAEDFVSPEHLNHCFRLTQEFRQLSETHSNHEDKLQVKNIVYHAVKDAIAVLRENDPDDE